MTYDQVLVFHKIVEVGSFKAAAAELHKTQPAISQSIKKLEEEMGVLLFDRSEYRPKLTDHGRVFFERSQRLLLGMQDLEGLTKSFREKDEPEISVSLDGVSPMPLLLSVLRKFGNEHPFTKLNLNLTVLNGAEDHVLNREASIGITHFLARPEALEIVPITKIRMLPVMEKTLFEEKNVRSQRDLQDIDQIVVGGGQRKSGMSFGLLDSGKKWRLNDFNFKRDIILSGLGWGHLPEHTVLSELREGKLEVLDFEDVHPRELEINLIRLKRVALGPVAKSLWTELTSLHG